MAPWAPCGSWPPWGAAARRSRRSMWAASTLKSTRRGRGHPAPTVPRPPAAGPLDGGAGALCIGRLVRVCGRPLSGAAPPPPVCLASVEAATGDPTALHDALTEAATPPARLRIDQPLPASVVAGVVADGLPGLLALHLSNLEGLSVDACLALSRLVDLRALHLGSGDPERLAVDMGAVSVLAPPALRRLQFHRVDFGVAGATGVVTAFSLASPQSLHDLVLHDCAGEVEGALAAVAGVRTLRRLVIAGHVEHMEVEGRPATLVSIGEDYRESVHLLATRRPDLAFAEEL
eukprot:TRINITY_DN17934_c0_g1_i1.p2 TRINITY_DN17934_c0_g1~~TRINITY_DN17934_c0_g1_i1.p2  ORF type:complete len:290 (-),score=61.94 TRINITY_DN17934_c0_g1_i1:112-981(-)